MSQWDNQHYRGKPVDQEFMLKAIAWIGGFVLLMLSIRGCAASGGF